MSEKPLPSLDQLKSKIEKAQAAATPPAPVPSAGSADTPDALRIGAELAAGIAVGAGIGIFLDRWLHTSPWLLIICFMLGCAAGFMNLKRAADKMGK